MVQYGSHSTHNLGKMQFDFSLGEGNTPFIKADRLAQSLGLSSLYLKDESTNPSGSFKDRATRAQLEFWTNHGERHFVLSSSGNAAASCALWANQEGISLDIFLSPNTAAYKVDRIKHFITTPKKRGDISLHISTTPKRDAIQFAKTNSAINLLHSKDDHALSGYIGLGKELLTNMHEGGITSDGIFIPASSGTGIMGMAAGLEDSIPLFAVQTTKIHPIAEAFDTQFVSTTTSLATCIVARTTQRKKAVIDMLTKTHGGAYVISDEGIQFALEIVRASENLNISSDSALSVAGLIKALKHGERFSSAICILTGI